MVVLLGLANGASGMESGAGDVLGLIENESANCLQGKKIVLRGNTPPNYDVPSMGAGDWFLYALWLTAKLESLGAESVVIDQPKFLKNFFTYCSDIGVFSDVRKGQEAEYIPLKVADILNVAHLDQFECNKRYMESSFYESEVEVVLENIAELKETVSEQTGREPKIVIFTRQSAGYTIKGKNEEQRQEQEALYGYLNHRSISREDLADMLAAKPDYVKVYNIQFEDQKEVNIAGTEKPTALYPGYAQRRGAFVNDAILMKAVVEAGGELVSVDTAATNLAFGIPRVDDDRKNIKVFLGARHNSRWKAPYLKGKDSVSWSKNVQLFTQENEDDWSDVGQKVVESWQE